MHDEVDRSEGVPWKKNCQLERRRFFFSQRFFSRCSRQKVKRQDFFVQDSCLILCLLFASMIDRYWHVPPKYWKIGGMEKAVDFRSKFCVIPSIVRIYISGQWKQSRSLFPSYLKNVDDASILSFCYFSSAKNEYLTCISFRGFLP